MYQVVANILQGSCFGSSCLHDRLTLLATLGLLIAEFYRLIENRSSLDISTLCTIITHIKGTHTKRIDNLI